MGITPWYVGQLLPLLTITFTDDSNKAVNLTGATLTLTIHNLATNSSVAGAGSFVITDAANGVGTYTLDAVDVATAGNYTVQAVATINGKPLKADPISWVIE